MSKLKSSRELAETLAQMIQQESGFTRPQVLKCALELRRAHNREDFIEEMQKAESEIHKMKTRHQVELKPLLLKREELKRQCPHEWVRAPNPAGERSEYHCPICGSWKE